MASSSSSDAKGWLYHVFLSFRGEDTRYGFTGHLYRDLRQRGIRTFIDDEGIRKGENISDTLFKVIEESKIAIVVFSENYASSTFCLKELVHILKCMKGVEGRSIWCVFYHVDPSDVRHQRNSYKDAFNKYEGVMEYKKSVDDWRSALKEAADLCSWHVKPGSRKYEYEITEEIIEAVSKKINDGPLHVARYPVALESQVEKVCSLLYQQHDCHGATMVGICGTGGIGKTTLARAVYNEIESQFKQYSCFLFNVRKKSIDDVLKTLLSKIIKEKDTGLECERSATFMIKDRLQRKKVLLILDDVDKLEQLEILVGEPNWFGYGSKIIITTRNKGLLAKHDIKKIYEVEELNYLDACRLLILNAFKKKVVDPEYENVIKRAVKYVCGLPLALEVMGSNLHGLTIEEWESALDLYERIPHETIQKVLQVSYHDLEKTHREIFLDIACFYKGYKLGYVTHMLQSSHGAGSKYCIRVLIDKCLIKIDENGCLGMHDLIQDMGQEIVRQESTLEPGKRSRLWLDQDILHVLKENTGTKNIQGIKLDLFLTTEVDWSGEAFEKMKNMRVLIIKGANFSKAPKCFPNSLRVLEWPNYPSSSLPSDFHPISLVILNLPHSPLKLEKPFKRLENLSALNLSNNQFITQVTDVSSVPNLRELVLDSCENLIEIHDSVGYLRKLEILSLKWCAKLCTFPHAIKLPSLRNLKLQGCSSLKNLPEILEKINGIAGLDLGETNLELPFSIRNLSQLRYLWMEKCQRIQLPSSIVMLPELKEISIKECGDLPSFKQEEGQESSYMVGSKVEILRLVKCNMSDGLLPICLPFFSNMGILDLSDSNITILPACIKECYLLWSLSLNNCKHLREIAAVPPSIQKLWAINCYSLSSESRSILLSQELHESGHKQFCVPAGRIPEWVDYSRSEPSISFWFRNKLPVISLCLIMPDDKSVPLKFLRVDVMVNGKKIYNHIPRALFGLRDHMYFNGLSLSPFIPDKWNHVQICANFGKQIGIIVIKQESNIMDIRFADPYKTEIKLADFMIDHSSSNVSSTCSSPKDLIFIEECRELLSHKHTVWSMVMSLRLINCNISDEVLLKCFSFFANMQSLDLSDGNFTILPTCIKECRFLWSLSLNNCKHLREIAAIPPGIRKLEAINCYSLSSESRSILLSQELHESGYKQFLMPAGRIPEWFHQSRSGPSISFWFYYKLPRISLCLIMPDDKCATSNYLSIDMRGNGIQMTILNQPILFDHMFLKDIHLPEFNPERKWNHVEICANFGKVIGIHVTNYLGNNIQFADPYNRKGKLDDHSKILATSLPLKGQEVIFIEKYGELLSFKQMWSNVMTLRLINCNMSHKFLPICLPFFSNMEILDLSGSNIKILPASVKQCGFLWKLILNDCKHLREIAAIPPSITELWAVNCYSLSSEWTGILLREELLKSGRKQSQFCVPAGVILEWSDHNKSGPSTSFWFRNKLPMISLGLTVPAGKHDHLGFSLIRVIINGQRTCPIFTRLISGTQDHTFVTGLSLHEPQEDLLIQEGRWNHVEVHADFAKEIGIYVNKQQCNINDIRFADPYTTLNLDDQVSSICLSHKGSLYDRDFNEVAESSRDDEESDLRQQHITEQIPESSENVRNTKGKEIVVDRDKTNEEEGYKALEGTCKNNQMTCQEVQVESNDHGTTRDRGRGGTGSEQRGDRLHLCLCILISSLVLYRYSFLLPWLLGFLGLLAVFYV